MCTPLIKVLENRSDPKKMSPMFSLLFYQETLDKRILDRDSTNACNVVEKRQRKDC